MGQKNDLVKVVSARNSFGHRRRPYSPNVCLSGGILYLFSDQSLYFRLPVKRSNQLSTLSLLLSLVLTVLSQ